MKPQLTQDFIAYYNEKVEPVAKKCAELFPEISAIENGKQFDDNDSIVLKIKALVDVNATWYIGLMISDIQTSILYGKSLNLINSVSQVCGCLNSASYWTNVWNEDVSSEEAKNLKELAALMPELLKKL